MGFLNYIIIGEIINIKLRFNAGLTAYSDSVQEGVQLYDYVIKPPFL